MTWKEKVLAFMQQRGITPKNTVDYSELYEVFVDVCEEVMALGLY